jgi:2-C-methyl-D-erythritol 2,4-cyclodiphosphate synthase
VRVGFGYDIHPLVSGRKLILGGVDIPFDKGLDGHSDADVLCHAVSDALLGAAALGDIGEHFPDDDLQYQGVSSLKLLEQVGMLLKENAFLISNVDATVVAEKPRLMPFKASMAARIASNLGLDKHQVSIKATTNERFGVIGRGEAIAAFAVASLVKTE